MAHRDETTHLETVKCKSSCCTLRHYPCSLLYVLSSFAVKGLKCINWCFPSFLVLNFLMYICALWFRFDSLDHSERLCTRSCFGPSFFVLMCSDCLRLSFVLVIRYTDRVFHFLALYSFGSGLFTIIASFYNLFHVYPLLQSVLHTCFVSLVPFACFALKRPMVKLPCNFQFSITFDKV